MVADPSSRENEESENDESLWGIPTSRSWRWERSIFHSKLRTSLSHQEPDEQPISSNFDGPPSQFWGLVNNFVDDFDDDLTNHHGYHFKIDPERIFRNVKLLGSGVVGTVQVMEIKGTGIQVACKVATRRERFEALREEAQLIKDISHEHIVRFIGSFETPGKKPNYGIVMSPIGDQDLGVFLREAGESTSKDPIHSRWLMSWFGCLASALAYLHNRGIRHEDIKPSNIIHRGDRIFFTDFGSSTTFNPDETTTTESWACGTRLYAAPEFLDKTKVHGARSDIFPLGCVFLEMLTVISGASIKSLQEFCKVQSESAGQTPLYSNIINDLLPWIWTLNSTPSGIIWKEIIQPMLRADRKERPSAQQVLQLLWAGPVPIIVKYKDSSCHCDHSMPLRIWELNTEQYSITAKSTNGEACLVDEMSTVESRIERLEYLHTLLSRQWLKRHDDFPYPFKHCFTENLRRASESGDKEHLQLLLSYPIDSNDRATALKGAVFGGHVEIVEYVLIGLGQVGYTTSITVELEAMTAALEAMSNGPQPCGFWNEGHRYSLNVGSETFDTPLQAAAYNGDETIVQLLLDAGVNVNSTAGYFGTALAIAAYEGNGRVVKTLIRGGADVNSPGGFCKNALEAASLGRHDYIRRILLENGADSDVPSDQFGTATCISSTKGLDKIVQVLLDQATEDAAAATPSLPIESEPIIHFKDTMGRTFDFPWKTCRTWDGIDELIKKRFPHGEGVSWNDRHHNDLALHVHQGHYDLVGPDEEIILPQTWETRVQPGWTITMDMWPVADMAPRPPPPRPPGPGPRVQSTSTSAPPPPPPAGSVFGRFSVPQNSVDIGVRQEKRRSSKPKPKPNVGFLSWTAGGAIRPAGKGTKKI